MVEKLKDTTKETARTRKELGVGWLEGPALESIVDMKLKDKEGRTVMIRKTPDERYYLETTKG